MAKSLAAQKKDLEVKLRNVINLKNKSDNAKWLPRMQKKFEGKYFTFNNGYNATERWNGYVYVEKVTSVCVLSDDNVYSDFNGFLIQRDCDGRIECKAVQAVHTSTYCEKEIAPKAFKIAVRNILNHMVDLASPSICIDFKLSDVKSAESTTKKKAK